MELTYSDQWTLMGFEPRRMTPNHISRRAVIQKSRSVGLTMALVGWGATFLDPKGSSIQESGKMPQSGMRRTFLATAVSVLTGAQALPDPVTQYTFGVPDYRWKPLPWQEEAAKALNHSIYSRTELEAEST